ncbi:hypothetical protein LP420_27070 [Massilia sp. B-10]|nr:hypothetical protein LP420_27070 [Massilia sp. B-10]
MHGCSEEAIQREVDYFGPDLIHAQGGTNDAAMAIADTSRIHAMIGYHFWSGLVTLGESGNRHIMDNLAGHALTPPPLPPSRTIWKYVASEFMQQVHLALGGKEKLNVIHAVSDRAQYHAPCGRTRLRPANQCMPAQGRRNLPRLRPGAGRQGAVPGHQERNRRQRLLLTSWTPKLRSIPCRSSSRTAMCATFTARPGW